MTRRRVLATCALAATALTAAACQKDETNHVGPTGNEALARFVSIGTSISMGTASDGVIAESQVHAWPGVVARQAFQPYGFPLISRLGCISPILAPLSLVTRLDGSTAVPGSSTAGNFASNGRCDPLVSGITIPTNDVAIDGATTYSAYYVTPESIAVKFPAASGNEAAKRQRYSRVLLPKQTQVTAALSQNPTFISVELGANEVLSSLGGILIPATPASYAGLNGSAAVAQGLRYSYVPFEVWQPVYDALMTQVASAKAKGVLLGTPNVSSLISMRTGQELWDSRAEFARRNITVAADCGGANAQNLLFVGLGGPVLAKVLGAGPAQTLSCADVPGTQDFVLTPANVETISGVAAQMNAEIKAQAAKYGYAFVDLDALLQAGVAATKAAETRVDGTNGFSPIKTVSCTLPYGQNVSLDGVHPTAAGQALLANAAIDAINTTYKLAIPHATVPTLTEPRSCP